MKDLPHVGHINILKQRNLGWWNRDTYSSPVGQGWKRKIEDIEDVKDFRSLLLQEAASAFLL
jgi:hypothetical protein